jgi:peptide-methionine (S)-S-oxide reductase
MEKATFGAGCFWGVEVAFRNVAGVTDVAVGYAGGSVDHPTYEQVCSDRTGHAEVVEVTFDPAKVSYTELLDVFWASHDPTQLNRQGPDVGSQYRSAIFVHDDAQQEAAEKSKATTIEDASTFWRAEEYHQQYLPKRGLATCRI